MQQRFVSIWFPHLAADWVIRREPSLHDKAFVLCVASHGRMVITAASEQAASQGIYTGMTVADARAIFPALQVIDEQPGLEEKLLQRIAEWCIRFTPVVAMDLPAGLLLDATGCAHLWGGEEAYLNCIVQRLKERCYTIHISMADTIGAAWAFARYGKEKKLITPKQHLTDLLFLPPIALRLIADDVDRLTKLGLRRIADIANMPKPSLRRRFGQVLVSRLNQALGLEEEFLQPVMPIPPYQERLTSLEPIVTATGIEIGLKRLLEALCNRLHKDGKGLRLAKLICHRIDGKDVHAEIQTSRPSANLTHLFKLFELKISSVEPGPGIELFVLEAPKVEDHLAQQEQIWGNSSNGLEDERLAELIDRLSMKFGSHLINRYLPEEHYWPERAIKKALELHEIPPSPWPAQLRPLQLLTRPEPIQVTAPVPDYPPMLFRYKNKLYTIKKADGPERIEAEWWLETGEHRDYYVVEDEAGGRYWLFRLGHYDTSKAGQWYLHGYFA